MIIEEILQIEKWGEEGFCGVLKDACDNVYRSRDKRTAESPRITVKMIQGEEEGHVFLFEATNTYQPDTWKAELEVEIATNRTTETKSDAHYILLGQVRSRLRMQQLCPLPNDNVIPERWTKHQSVLLLSSIKATGTKNDVSDPEDLDKTTLTFELLCYINPTAWPSNPNL